MFLIFFALSQFEIPRAVQVTIGLVGGSYDFIGLRAFRNGQKQIEAKVSLKRDSVIAGSWMTAANEVKRYDRRWHRYIAFSDNW